MHTMSFIRKIKRGEHIYLAEVENTWIDGKVVQKHIRYVGRQLGERKIFSGSVEDTDISQVKIYAPFLALHHLAKEIGLSEILGDYGEYLLCLAYAHCVDPKSLNAMEQWLKRTDLDKLLEISDLSEKKLYYALDSIDERAAEQIQNRIFVRLQEKFKLKPKSHFFDVTNVYFYGTECPIAKRGKNKEGKKKPQVQIGLAVTSDEGLPIFHKTFDGNIFDSRVLQDMMVSFSKMNIHDVFIVWDRGISSEANITDAKRAGYEVICGLANHDNVKPTVEKMICNKDFVALPNRVRLKNTVLYCKAKRFSYGAVHGKLVVCFNEEAARVKRERRLDKIAEAKKLIEKHKQPSEEMVTYFVDGKVSEAKIAQEQKYDGYSIIFSTQELSTQEIVRAYFEKDVIEKAFRSMKSILGLQPIRHWLEERVKAHVFVCYLSYLLLSMLEYKLKEKRISAVEALDKLSTAYKVYLKNKKTQNEFEKVVLLTQEQQDILKLVDKSLLPSVHK